MEEKLTEILRNILAGLDPEKTSTEYGYYLSLFGDELPKVARSKEHSLACIGVEYEEMQELMREIVEAIIALNRRPFARVLWEDDQEQAGSAFARELAFANKTDVVLYARHLATNDLDHEVYQIEDLQDIITKWGFCKEVYAAMAARIGGQHGEEFYEEYLDELQQKLEDPKERDDYIEMLARMYIERWKGEDYQVEFARDLIDPIFSMLFGTPSVDDFWDNEPDDYEPGDEYSAMTRGFVAAVNEGRIPKYSEINPD